MKQYAIYLRKSRADLELEAKGELETLARHEKTLLALAKTMQLNVTEIYREVVSGETIAARPVVQQLLQEVEDGMWTGVLVMEIERLARGDTIDQGVVARAFKERNTKIITPSKSYDPSNEFDEEYFEFGLFMSRREYKTINRRIQRGRIASVQEGKFISSTPPYGYNKVKITNDKGYTLEPNEESHVVKMIFELYAAGNGMTVICNKLDDLHIKPRYRDTWSKSTIKDILNNPVYNGKIRWSYRKEKKQNLDNKVVKLRRKSDDYIEVNGLHPAIIDDELFQKVQYMINIKRKQPVKKTTTLQNPLSGLVYCKKCGSLMTRLAPNPKNKYSTLKCPNRACNNVSSPLFLVEENIINQFSSWLKEYKLSFEVEQPAIAASTSIQAKKNTLDQLEVELKKVIDQINNTFDLIEQGIYTPEIFTERNNILSKKKERILEAIKETTESIERESSFEMITSSYIPFVEGILNNYKNIPTEELKNQALKSIIERVEYQKDNPNTRGKLLNDNFEIQIYPIAPH